MGDLRPITCQRQKATLSFLKTVWPAETKANLPLSITFISGINTTQHPRPTLPDTLPQGPSPLSFSRSDLKHVVGKVARTPRRQQRPRLYRRPKSRRRPRPQMQSHSLLRHPRPRSNKSHSNRIRHQESVSQTQLAHPSGQERLQWRRRGFQDGCSRFCGLE